MVIGGNRSDAHLRPTGLIARNHSKLNRCATIFGDTQTTYVLSANPDRVNALRVSRTFTFNAQAATQSDNLRAYVARLPLQSYPYVLVPETGGTIVKLATCDTACEISVWNGRWFALDDGKGDGIAIIRDSRSNTPAVLITNSDGTSNSNLSSIALREPVGGWSGTVTEVQWLCFYDAATWPKDRQSAGKLPAGCVVPEHP